MAASGRLLRDGAERCVRVGGARRRARADGPAQRDIRAAPAGGHRRHDGGLSQRRSHLPQRLLAVEGEAVRSGTLCRGPIEVGAVRSAWRGPRVLRDPLAHERIHPGLHTPLLRRDRCGRPLPDRRRAARHLHPGGLDRGRGARHQSGHRNGRQPDRRGRLSPAMTLFSSLTNRIFLACALLAVATTGVAVYVVGARATHEAETELARGLADAATQVAQQQRALVARYVVFARLLADLPKLKSAVDTQNPPTIAPIVEDYRRQVSADLLLITGRDGAVLARGGDP